MRRVNHRKNIAELVVRRGPILERQEPSKKFDLLLAEPCDFDEALCPRQHCQQAQQEDLLKRIDDLAGLPRVRQIAKKTQKNEGFALRSRARRRFLQCHRDTPA